MPTWKKLTLVSSQQGIEIMVVLFLVGVNFVPGGHQQFQLWYVELVPLALMMTGFSPILTFWLYTSLYPCELAEREYHHLVLLFISMWLMIKPSCSSLKPNSKLKVD
jgi:hypothetical protein